MSFKFNGYSVTFVVDDILKKLKLLEIFKEATPILILIMQVRRITQTSSGITTRV